MSLLAPTPSDKLVDAQGRPYFLWDLDWTLEHFVQRLGEAPRVERAWLVGKLMRQAKPDDVFSFVGLADIRDLWPDLERYLGHKREFWTWLMERWADR